MIRKSWQWLLTSARRDGRTKLMAAVVALVAFQIIRTNISEMETFRVRVVANQPHDGGFTVVKVEPSDVSVTLRGSRDQLRVLREDAMSVTVQARQIPANGGSETISLRRAQVEGIGYARVDSLEPSHVQLDYEIEGNVRLAVARPLLVGTPLVGTAEIGWTETNVVVRGPLTQLRTLYDNAVPLATEKIDVDGRVQSFTRRVRILPPPDIGNVSVTPSEIDVRVAIKVETETRVYENIPVLLTAVTGSGLILTSEPATVTVRVTGMAERLDQVRPEAISVVADCRDIVVDRTAEASYPLRVFLPPRVEGLTSESTPPSVTVRARRVVAPEPKPEPTVRTEEVVAPPPAAP